MTKGFGDEYNSSDNLQPIEISNWHDEYPSVSFFLNGYEFIIGMIESTGFPVTILVRPQNLDNDRYIKALQATQPYYEAFWAVTESYMGTDDDLSTYGLDSPLKLIGLLMRGLNQNLIVIPDHIREKIYRTINGQLNLLPKSAGFVYLLRAIMPETHYKIGYSANPTERIESMGVKLPFPIKPLHVIPTDNARKAEKWWHEKYAHARMGGEWFKLSDKEIQSFRQVEHLSMDGAS
jgi:hypothetical protein